MYDLPLNKYFIWATLIMVAFIVYGSLFPFEFHARGGVDAFTALLTTWKLRPEHAGNLIGNVFFYAPFGLFGVLSLGDRINNVARLFLVVAMGTALCVSMELIQFHDAGRVSTLADVYPNVLGTAVGAAAGLVAGPRFRWRLAPGLQTQPGPVLLLFAFLAYRLFPYVPSLDVHQYWQAIKPMVRQPRFAPDDIAGYAVLWLVVASLGRALLGAARARMGLAPAVLCVVAAKVVILHNHITAAELIGASVACLAWMLLGRIGPRTQSAVVALVLAFSIAVTRLQPFEFLAHPRAFGWIPFQSFMHGSMTINTLSFLEKFFLYGSLIWLLARAGLRLVAAGTAVALGLLMLSAIQTWLPGRSAEITDAVMALVITAIFALVQTRQAVSTPAGVNRNADTAIREDADDGQTADAGPAPVATITKR